MIQLDVIVVMDPIDRIKIAKDTTFALLLEAQRRGHRLHYVAPGSLHLCDGRVFVHAARLAVDDNSNHWFDLEQAQVMPLGAGQIVLMRKDPPVTMEFIYNTHLLEIAQTHGAHVINAPQGLRDFNEKLAAQLFPQCCPPTLVTRSNDDLKAFIATYKTVVIKPLDGMGGRSIFRCNQDDPNLNVILETMTQSGQHLAMAQRFIPEIRDGDKRIFLIDGQPIPYCLARIPQGTEFRGNLAAGGRGQGQALSQRDKWIANQVGPELMRRGMRLVGLDIIGDYLTEINVTSPTCMRELDAQFNLNIAAQFFAAVEADIA